MGHGSTYYDPWPMWPIRNCDLFDPLAHDPLTHRLFCFGRLCGKFKHRRPRIASFFCDTATCFFSTEKWLNEIHYQPVSTSKTITDDASIEVVEIIIADCSPVSRVIDFQSSLVRRTSVSGQPDIWTSSFSDYTHNVHEKMRTIFLLIIMALTNNKRLRSRYVEAN